MTYEPGNKVKSASMRSQRMLGNRLVFFLLAVGAVIMIVPLWWMVISSLKTPTQFLMTQLTLAFPEKPQWNNYIRVWSMKPLLHGFINSAIIAVTVITVGTYTSAMAAFAFSKLRFPGKNKLFLALLGTMMIPFAITMIPQFIIYSKIGWLNTWFPLIVPGLLGNVTMIFFLRQYIDGIPTSMIESARIDGASFFQIFRKIIMPNAMPAVSAQGILWFMAIWNDYFAPSLYINDETKMPIQVLIQSLNSYYSIQTDYPAILAASVLALLPVLLVFIIFQKQIISSVAMTGLK
jgi:multiple sugar transport system permease protein